eukprot:6143-Chlamydomonas_euryale.AAC.3
MTKHQQVGRSISDGGGCGDDDSGGGSGCGDSGGGSGYGGSGGLNSCGNGSDDCVLDLPTQRAKMLAVVKRRPAPLKAQFT